MSRVNPASATLLFILAISSTGFAQTTAQKPAAGNHTPATGSNAAHAQAHTRAGGGGATTSPCGGEIRSVQFLEPTDAAALAKVLNGLFGALKFEAVESTKGTDKKLTGEICVSARDSKAKLYKCGDAPTAKGTAVFDCGLDDTFAALDLDGFKGGKLDGKNIFRVQHLSAEGIGS